MFEYYTNTSVVASEGLRLLLLQSNLAWKWVGVEGKRGIISMSPIEMLIRISLAAIHDIWHSKKYYIHSRNT